MVLRFPQTLLSFTYFILHVELVSAETNSLHFHIFLSQLLHLLVHRVLHTLLLGSRVLHCSGGPIDVDVDDEFKVSVCSLAQCWPCLVV